MNERVLDWSGCVMALLDLYATGMDLHSSKVACIVTFREVRFALSHRVTFDRSHAIESAPDCTRPRTARAAPVACPLLQLSGESLAVLV